MTGVRALLLTDVVDSTSLAESLGGEAMTALWRAHDRVARDLLAQWRGREIEKTDGLLALFEHAADAAGFALAYHRALANFEPPLRARAGLHTAHIDLRENDVSDQARGAIPVEVEGIGKVVAARTMTTALGGQTLMTGDARASLGVTRLRLQSHGHWRFKGMTDPIELFEIGDAASPFVPPPDSDKAYRVVRQGDLWRPVRQVAHDIPAERDRFVGRREPLQDIKRRLDGDTRLLSILGPGGSGKTRLAIRFGWAWLGEFPGGVWFCDLSQARSLDGVYFAVAKALDVPLGKTDPQIQLAHAVSGRGACLVIFDNFEQVARYAEQTLGHWLDKAPQAKFLVTTREVLAISGEGTLVLGPLPIAEASDLFLRRLDRIGGVAKPVGEDATIIEQLVKVLDGLPLAIEIAAARCRIMSPRTLLARMSERFKVLKSSGARQDRQATLRTALDWSWELLSAGEKAALAQLSVFEGGFTLDSAGAVVELPDATELVWLPDVMHGLVDKSLVRSNGDDRFDMLETIREYAAEHLCTEGRYPGSGPASAAGAQRRHCRYFAGVDELSTGSCDLADADNLVLACRRACVFDDGAAAAGALGGAWGVLKLRGPFRVAVQLVEQVDAIPDLRSHHRTLVDWVAGCAHHVLGKADVARPRLEAGLARARLDADRLLEARFLCMLGEQQTASSTPNAALPTLERALSLATELGDGDLCCGTLSAQGDLHYKLGQVAQARASWEAALATARSTKNERWEGGILGNLGNLEFGEGKLDEARSLYEQCLASARRSGDRRWEGNMLCNLGMLDHEQGRTAKARAEFEEALAMARAMGHARLECMVLCNLGIVLETLGDPLEARSRYEEAVRLASELVDRRAEGQFRGYLGLLLARTGNADAGLACLGVGEKLLLQASDPISLGLLLCRRAEADHRSGRPVDAMHALRRVEAIASDGKATPQSELGQALALLGKMLTAPDKPGPRSADISSY